MKRPYKFFKNPIYMTAKAFALAVFPFVLLILPKTYFDKGQSLCLFTLLTGENCYGCGLTRACMHIIHLDFDTAANFNKMAFIVFPIMCFLYAQEFVKTAQKSHLYRKYLLKHHA